MIRRSIRFSATILILLLAVAARPGIIAAQEASTGSSPGDLQAHLGKAYDALKQERYDTAATELRAALAIDPTLTLKARFPLAVSLFELHQSDDARRELETVRQEIGDHPNVLYYLGRLDLDNRDYAGAIRNLNKAVVKPPFPDTSYYLGFAYFKQNALKDAEKWLKEASAANPRDSRVPYQLAQVFRKQGLDAQAKQELALSEQLRQKRDDDTKVKAECGKKLDEGPREEAHAVCDQLYDAGSADRLTALGTIYGQHGDLDAALKPLRRAAELAPQAPQMRYNLALTYFQLGRFEDARSELAGAAKQWPDLFPIVNLYGATLLKLGDTIPAYEALNHAHQLNPQEAATTSMLYDATMGTARKQQADKQYVEAQHLFQQASELRPDEPGPHLGLSEVYAFTGRVPQAREEQKKAEELSKVMGKQP